VVETNEDNSKKYSVMYCCEKGEDLRIEAIGKDGYRAKLANTAEPLAIDTLPKTKEDCDINKPANVNFKVDCTFSKKDEKANLIGFCA